jgi:hypothetical protein
MLLALNGRHRLRILPVHESPPPSYNCFFMRDQNTSFNSTIHILHSLKLKMIPKYHIRPASSAQEDGKKILEFTDSQLPYLASIGSAEQWGSASIAARDAAQQKYAQLVERSEKKQTWGLDWYQMLMLEVEVDPDALPETLRSSALSQDQEGRLTRLPVAAMVLEGRSSDYTRPVLPEQDARDPFVWVRYLVTDRRAGALSKGCGQRLLDYADEVARSMGLNRLCLDGWNGNDYLLIK